MRAIGACCSAAGALAILVVACTEKTQSAKSTYSSENLVNAASAYAAAAENTAASQALEEEWSRIATTLPTQIEQQQKHSPGQRQTANAEVLWSKAQAAFAAGNLREAVSTANTASDQLNAP